MCGPGVHRHRGPLVAVVLFPARYGPYIDLIGGAFMRSVAAVLLLLLTGLTPAAAESDPWQALSEKGTHIIMRHALAPGTGDPPGFILGDCATQRVLNDEGRAEARAAGEAIRRAGQAIDVVLTSAWCRTEETARLLDLVPVRVEPALNSFFQDRTTEPEQTSALARIIAGLGTKRAVLVTHQVNITALTGVVPSSGEMIVVSIDSSGKAVVHGRIPPPSQATAVTP